METDIKHEIHQPQHQEQSLFASVWYFVRHYIEMCLAMCIGGIPLIFLFFWGAARLGYPDFVQRFPELSIMVIGIILSLIMGAWMRIRGMTWRLSLEMGSTTILLGILLVGLSGLGILQRSSQLEWMKLLACPVMLIPMFIRLDHYSGRMDHSLHSMHAMH